MSQLIKSLLPKQENLGFNLKYLYFKKLPMAAGICTGALRKEDSRNSLVSQPTKSMSSRCVRDPVSKIKFSTILTSGLHRHIYVNVYTYTHISFIREFTVLKIFFCYSEMIWYLSK